MHTNKSPKELFWEKINKNGRVVRAELGPCWEWTAAIDGCGYGKLWFEGSFDRAHRVGFVLQGGSIPVGLFVLHHCDNPSCVRFSHLYVGTKTDNARDRENRGRGNHATGERNGRATHPETTSRGSHHYLAKLTEEDVRTIRQLHKEGTDGSKLARRYGVSTATMSEILRGVGWAHAGGPIRTEVQQNGWTGPQGERNVKAKLTASVVRSIRQEAEQAQNYLELAVKYGVTPGTIGKIIRREIWKHVES